MKRSVPLEKAAEAVCDQSAVPPLIFQLPPEQGRRVLEDAQDTPVYKYPADISVREIDTLTSCFYSIRLPMPVLIRRPIASLR